jgi:ABC-type multidrug transport system permease subunit
MRLSKNSKKAGLALIGSLAGFLAAKRLKAEEIYPFILIGGFIGNYIGEEYIPEEYPNFLGHLTSTPLTYINSSGHLIYLNHN